MDNQKTYGKQNGRIKRSMGATWFSQCPMGKFSINYKVMTSHNCTMAKLFQASEGKH